MGGREGEREGGRGEEEEEGMKLRVRGIVYHRE